MKSLRVVCPLPSDERSRTVLLGSEGQEAEFSGSYNNDREREREHSADPKYRTDLNLRLQHIPTYYRCCQSTQHGVTYSNQMLCNQ